MAISFHTLRDLRYNIDPESKYVHIPTLCNMYLQILLAEIAKREKIRQSAVENYLNPVFPNLPFYPDRFTDDNANEYPSQVFIESRQCEHFVALETYPQIESFFFVGMALLEHRGLLHRVYHLYIQPEYRRRHIGTDFIRHIVTYERTKHNHSVILIPPHGNEIGKKFCDAVLVPKTLTYYAAPN